MMLRGGITWRKLSPTFHQSDVAYVGTILSGSIMVCGSSIQCTQVSASDDFIYPPELNMMAEMIKRVPNGMFVLLPNSDATRGHGKLTMPAVSSQCLEELLRESEPDVPAKR